MKKLIFLLLTLVIGVGTVFAVSGPYHPPGGFDPEMILAEYSVREGVVTQPTVLVLAVETAIETIAQPIRFQAVMAYNDTAVQPQIIVIGIGEIPIIDTGQSKAVFAESANKLHC